MVLLLVGSIQMLSHFRNVPIGKASRFLLLSNKTDTSWLLSTFIYCTVFYRSTSRHVRRGLLPHFSTVPVRKPRFLKISQHLSARDSALWQMLFRNVPIGKAVTFHGFYIWCTICFCMRTSIRGCYCTCCIRNKLALHFLPLVVFVAIQTTIFETKVPIEWNCPYRTAWMY
jgi:hypothetical protein